MMVGFLEFSITLVTPRECLKLPEARNRQSTVNVLSRAFCTLQFTNKSLVL